MLKTRCLFVGAVLLLGACSSSDTGGTPDESVQRTAARWDHLPSSAEWTLAAQTALQQHGAALAREIPADIADYCPAYPSQDVAGRNAFWVGLASALAKHESTWQPAAVGGGGRWFGLLQISPGTARGYGCQATSGQALTNGADNLSCAVRIWAVTVPRDGVVSAGMRGVAADWGPFHSTRKRTDMMEWTRAQDYCRAS